MAVVLLVAIATIVCVFAVAATAKSRSIDVAATDMANLLGTSTPVARWLVLATILSEIAIAVAVLTPKTRTFGFLGSLVLLGTFSLILTTALRRGRSGPCSCFGSRSRGAVGIGHIARNGILMLFAALGLIATKDSALAPEMADYVLAGGPAFFVVGVTIFWDDFADLAPRF